jgi:hypothetical protein
MASPNHVTLGRTGVVSYETVRRTVRYLGIEVDDALLLSEQTDL